MEPRLRRGEGDQDVPTRVCSTDSPRRHACDPARWDFERRWVQTERPEGRLGPLVRRGPQRMRAAPASMRVGIRVWSTVDERRELDTSHQRPHRPERIQPARRAQRFGRQRHPGRHELRRLSLDKQRSELERDQQRNPKPLGLCACLGSQRLGRDQPVCRGLQGNAFRSTDNGASWTAIQSGLPTGYNVNALITTSAGTVLAGDA